MPKLDCTVTYRNVVGAPGYRVGNDGSVWSCRILGWRGGIGSEWRLLKPSRTKVRKHLYVRLAGAGHRYVHRMVLEAFVGQCPPGMHCRHFPDRDPSNNRLDNLQWGTQIENEEDKRVHGTRIQGEGCHQSKVTEKQVREIRKLYKNPFSQGELAARYGITQPVVWAIIHRKTWKHI